MIKKDKRKQHGESFTVNHGKPQAWSFIFIFKCPHRIWFLPGTLNMSLHLDWRCLGLIAFLLISTMWMAQDQSWNWSGKFVDVLTVTRPISGISTPGFWLVIYLSLWRLHATTLSAIVFNKITKVRKKWLNNKRVTDLDLSRINILASFSQYHLFEVEWLNGSLRFMNILDHFLVIWQEKVIMPVCVYMLWQIQVT